VGRERPQRSRKARRRCCAPRVELLEDRTVPSNYTVTNLLDDGSAGSLRQAILAANADPGSTITFTQAGTIQLASQLSVTASRRITGLGVDQLTIRGLGNPYRIFDIAHVSGQPTIDVEMDSLTLTHGRTGLNTLNDGGGAIRNSERLTLTDVKITDSWAAAGGSSAGGGICNRNGGTLTLSNCILGDAANPNKATYGGGIANYGGPVTLTNCILPGNTASYGGAIYKEGGTLTLTNNCTLSGSTANYGGTIYNYVGATLTLSNTLLSGNSATQEGGSIDNYYGTATLTDCTLSGYAAENGGGTASYGTLTLSNSTLLGSSNNGGGISNTYGTVTLTNSTLSGHKSANGQSGIQNLQRQLPFRRRRSPDPLRRHRNPHRLHPGGQHGWLLGRRHRQPRHDNRPQRHPVG